MDITRVARTIWLYDVGVTNFRRMNTCAFKHNEKKKVSTPSTPKKTPKEQQQESGTPHEAEKSLHILDRKQFGRVRKNRLFI